jgi:hypothetical protein
METQRKPHTLTTQGFMSALLIGVAAGWLTVNAVTMVHAGSLSGAYTVLASASTINLTAEGLIDWAHWGYSTPTSFNHKAGVASEISNFTLIGTGPVLQFGDNFTGYSWTDGAPQARATRATSGIYVIGEGNGFEISVPADTTMKTLKVYVGAYAAQMHFEAGLSDNSAPPYVDESFENPADGPNRIYTLNFAASSAGQRLTVRFWVMTNLGQWDNVTLQAAVLREAAPLLELIKPVSGSIFYPASDGIQFRASTISPFTIPANQVRLFLNDADVSSNLVLTGTPLSRTATYTSLQPNLFYRGQIVVADDLNRSTTVNFIFDTFSTSGSVVIETEDYNYSAGSFIDNPTPGAYEGLNGVADVDYSTASAGGSIYRAGDPIVTQTSSDLPREPFTSAARSDYQIADLQNGDWLNYTRTFPNGYYNLYLRYAALVDQTVRLDRVTSDPTQPGQTLSALGTISAPRTGNENSYRYAPMTDALGKPIVLSLGGKVTVRLTALDVVSGFNGLRASFLLFAPITGTVGRLPVIDSAFPAPDAEDVPPDAGLRIVIADGDTAANPASIRLYFDALDVTASARVTDTPGGATIIYQPPALLPMGSIHRVGIEFADNASPANAQTNQWTFMVATLPVIPAAYSTPAGSGRTSGFNIRIAKAPDSSDAATFTNTAARAELQLAGQLIDSSSGQPFINEAAGPNGDGTYIEPNVINYEQEGLDAGYFSGDAPFPGVFPAAPNYMAMAVTAYLDLPAGIHRFGVRSDDGFRLAVGPYFTNANLVLGEFEGDRGSGLPGGSTEFEFLVQSPGVYAFRLLWYEGVGGADLEWFSVDRSTLGTASVVRTLINDAGTSGSVEAYQARVGSPSNQPKPPLLSPTLTAGDIVISFPTETGFTYTVECKGSLSDPAWQGAAPAVAGDGSVRSVRLAASGLSYRFYRVRAE